MPGRPATGAGRRPEQPERDDVPALLDAARADRKSHITRDRKVADHPQQVFLMTPSIRLSLKHRAADLRPGEVDCIHLGVDWARDDQHRHVEHAQHLR